MKLNCDIMKDINEYSFNKFSINDIKDYDSLDIEIINSLLYIKYDKNLIDILLDYVPYESLSTEQYKDLLINIGNNNINNIINYIKK